LTSHSEVPILKLGARLGEGVGAFVLQDAIGVLDLSDLLTAFILQIPGPARQGLVERRRAAPRCVAVFASALLLSVLFVLPSELSADAPADERSGATVYTELCASCHGQDGQGVATEHPQPLAGDRTLEALTRYIEKRMPKDEPELCVGEDAELVSRFIWDSFYSPIAQARRRPPRVELARLTVRQHRHVLADLLTPMTVKVTAQDDAAAEPSSENGLRAEYFNSRQPGDARVVERIDPTVRFDFSAMNPSPEQLGTQGFAARWQGSLSAPEPGVYEIIVRTDHAARLWLNGRDEPLIDAWVKSGSDTEYRAPIPLLDGHVYPIRLEFSSRQQGVEKKPETAAPVPAFIELWWRLPGQAPEVIPARHLLPSEVPEVFVATTPMPPDDRSYGYERGSSVSKAWVEAVSNVAIEAARHVRRDFDRIVLGGSAAGRGDREGRRRRRRDAEEAPNPHAEAAAARERQAKSIEFGRQFVARAFRRPLSEDDAKLCVDAVFESTPDAETAVDRIILRTLTSPRFLYVDFGRANPDPWDLASRLSFTLWDSIPDEGLRTAAASGQLATRDDVSREASRLVGDRRARAKMQRFLHRWLLVERPSPSKQPALFPDFDESLASKLRTSLDLFLEEVVWSGDADFRKLLLSNELWVDGPMAKYYGLELAPDAPFSKVTADARERAGVLSHPYLMATFAYSDVSSPIHRGVFLLRGVLGRPLRPPPEAFAPIAADLHPDLTTRERVSLQTSPDACRSCHSAINPLGFALERFDPVGRYRSEERGRPIDASGSLEDLAGETQTFDGVRELAELLASSEEVHRAFVTQVFHQLVQQSIFAYGIGTRDALVRNFRASSFDIRRLLAEIATTSALGAGAGPPVELRTGRRVRL
jgi:hypothetical protein